MGLTINIKGKGKVDKVVAFNTATLTAIPDDSWLFKYFMNEGIVATDNPYTFDYNEADSVVIDTVFYIPIESYLRGLVGFDVPDSAITSILIYRQIDFDADVNDLTKEQKELAYADLLMWAATNPTSYTGAKDSDGGWSHTEASKTISVSDKKRFEQMANDIYIKYNDCRKMKSGIRATSWDMM